MNKNLEEKVLKNLGGTSKFGWGLCGGRVVGSKAAQKEQGGGISFSYQAKELRLDFRKPMEFEYGSDTTGARIPGRLVCL